jgi:hypothetical protein
MPLTFLIANLCKPLLAKPMVAAALPITLPTSRLAPRFWQCPNLNS